LVFDEISFFLAGDAFQSRRLSVYGETRDVAPLFDRVRAADVGFVNLEITIHGFEGCARAHLQLKINYLLNNSKGDDL
jgi:hypothetical protein